MYGRKKFSILFLLFFACFVFAKNGQEAEPIGVAHTLRLVQNAAPVFLASLQKLKSEIEALQPQPKSRQAVQRALIESRQAYKKLQAFVEYFFSRTSNIFNRPVSYEIETPFIEYEEPIGLQVIEDKLFSEDWAASGKAMLAQADALVNSAENTAAVLFTLKISDAQILESLRLEIIRIATLGITGADAPQLKTGLSEAMTSLATVQAILEPYAAKCPLAAKDSLDATFTRCQELLRGKEFDSFDRLGFLFNGLFPLQERLSALISELRLPLNTVPQVNYAENNLFAAGFLAKEAFYKGGTEETVSLGRRLFFDKRLSQNGRTSCASCHAPEKAFTDGRAKSIAFNGLPARRNSPSVLYAVYQGSQFWDGREKSLEDQVKAVLLTTTEMTGHPQAALEALRTDDAYQQSFQKLFPDSSLSFSAIARAIAAYESTLTPFTSAFDRFAAGNEKALTAEQKRGFNLFMGKAKCGTCHFAPLFSGLVPPYFNQTDLEILGTPATATFVKPKLDADSGQFHTVPLPFSVGAFKTPSLRNVAATAPYMHNGVYRTLDEVMTFYDKGGGQGLGIRLAYQTLPAKPLRLKRSEKKAVILFLHSLTDEKQKQITAKNAVN